MPSTISQPTPAGASFCESDRALLLAHATALEQKAAAIRSACEGHPIEFGEDDEWFPDQPDFLGLMNPYSMFRPSPAPSPLAPQ